ncbi:hypothetical protein HHI36_012727 [Cryptolaemus montrouzieri]|uniref:Uncharacterized protein n=1 Tax=Cryptolaemus montrouzieri TaxID=559131 RepID=A0ABD2NF37_9CUCU
MIGIEFNITLFSQIFKDKIYCEEAMEDIQDIISHITCSIDSISSSHGLHEGSSTNPNLFSCFLRRRCPVNMAVKTLSSILESLNKALAFAVEGPLMARRACLRPRRLIQFSHTLKSRHRLFSILEVSKRIPRLRSYELQVSSSSGQ